MDSTGNIEWRDISGFEGSYQVSSDGLVRSLTRTLADGRVFQGRLLKEWIDKKGYANIALPDRKHRIHRLVALAFIPNPENLPMVLHSDGNSRNNHVSNLRWGTASDNVQDAVKHGTHMGDWASRPECKRGHPLTGDNVYTPPGTNFRYCKTCQRARQSNTLEVSDTRHGKLAGYSAGCRCADCKAARAAYQQSWSKK